MLTFGPPGLKMLFDPSPALQKGQSTVSELIRSACDTHVMRDSSDSLIIIRLVYHITTSKLYKWI